MKENMFARFSHLALTRQEMKSVKAGEYICRCNPYDTNGLQLHLEYMTGGSSGSACSNPTAGAAFYWYKKGGNKYQGYISNQDAADLCAFNRKFT